MNSQRSSDAALVIDTFGELSGLQGLEPELVERADGPYLGIEICNPTDRFYRLLEQALRGVSEDNMFHARTTLRKRPPVDKPLLLPEARLLRTVLSESLTVDRHSFGEDFFARYIESVSGAEDQILSEGNHIVYGRRGAGKSSLLAYAMHTMRQRKRPFAWIALQVFASRDDAKVILQVLREVFREVEAFAALSPSFDRVRVLFDKWESLDDDALGDSLRRELPTLRRVLEEIQQTAGPIAIFLDDLHLLDGSLQPELLATLYSLSRGNRISLKISSIEQFTRMWNPETRRGLQSPHDAQVIRLDYNLTMPDKSLAQIESILDAHAVFCGLPSAKYLANAAARARLVWVAAGVPRDALHLFAQAMVKSTLKGHRSVTVTSINSAASEMTESKLRELEQDAPAHSEGISRMLQRVREFCVRDNKQNAFLVEIVNDAQQFVDIQNLIALRMLHVLSEAITPHEAGRRYMALMLDYGFYVGIRAAKSIDLFQKKPRTPQAKELRKLPIFNPYISTPEL